MKATKKCYYEVLGIVKPSEEVEIRKAYKKLALKWHPDKNPDNIKEAEEKFKEIGEAYACLSDKEKKEVYDRYGHEGLTPGQERTPGGRYQPGRFSDFSGFSFGSANDIFNNLFKGGFFDDDDDFFAGHFKSSPSNKGKSQKTPTASPFGNLGRFGAFGHFGFDDHEDDIFSKHSMFTDFSRMDSGSSRSGVSKSKSTSTVIKDGKKVVTEKVTSVQSDGSKTIEIKETVSDADGRNAVQKRYIQDAQGQRKEIKN